MIARDYAKALFTSQASNLSGLAGALKRRGHEKLWPRIAAEYEKLVEQEKRTEHYRTTTPKQEQTRALLELYQRLIKTSNSNTTS